MSLILRSPELDTVNTTDYNKFEKHNALTLGPAVCSWVCHSSPKRKTLALLFVCLSPLGMCLELVLDILPCSGTEPWSLQVHRDKHGAGCHRKTKTQSDLFKDKTEETPPPLDCFSPEVLMELQEPLR